MPTMTSKARAWEELSTPERIMSITAAERYPRIWTYADQLAISPGRIRRVLNDLVAEGKLCQVKRGRGDTYWHMPTDSPYGDRP
jgi:hypothetical protein